MLHILTTVNLLLSHPLCIPFPSFLLLIQAENVYATFILSWHTSMLPTGSSRFSNVRAYRGRTGNERNRETFNQG